MQLPASSNILTAEEVLALQALLAGLTAEQYVDAYLDRRWYEEAVPELRGGRS